MYLFEYALCEMVTDFDTHTSSSLRAGMQVCGNGLLMSAVNHVQGFHVKVGCIISVSVFFLIDG